MIVEPYVEVWKRTEIHRSDRILSTLFGMRWSACAHDEYVRYELEFAYTRERAIKKAVRSLRVQRPDPEHIALRDIA